MRTCPECKLPVPEYYFAGKVCLDCAEAPAHYTKADRPKKNWTGKDAAGGERERKSEVSGFPVK